MPDQETINRKAIRITDISPQAVDFLLSIHTHWSDPVTDADYREITDQAVAPRPFPHRLFHRLKSQSPAPNQ